MTGPNGPRSNKITLTDEEKGYHDHVTNDLQLLCSLLDMAPDDQNNVRIENIHSLNTLKGQHIIIYLDDTGKKKRTTGPSIGLKCNKISHFLSSLCLEQTNTKENPLLQGEQKR